MHEHPIETQKIVARYLDIPIGQLSWTWDDYTFRLVLSNSLLSNLQIQARWALENGLVAGEMPDYRKLIVRTHYDRFRRRSHQSQPKWAENGTVVY
ncbi:hypothetical protein [Vibrio vulnificus]|uniref:hypothetical protein n=1 Tax=Vibrio vulnificus TaxID=672 RepID=UPI001F533663|nr:hypothetical protein [Vibrio vulnificus]